MPSFPQPWPRRVCKRCRCCVRRCGRRYCWRRYCVCSRCAACVANAKPFATACRCEVQRFVRTIRVAGRQVPA
eukprot:11192214-Lingulodinium_polyedra.AAC.1